VVGKVEVRKRQFEIAQLDLESAVNFYGAIHDSRVSQEFLKRLRQPHVFHGEVDRHHLASLLPSNSVLLHLSFSEADALVLYEAQLAGLAIVVTEGSLGSQDKTLPWVYVVPDDWSFEEVKKAVDDARIYVRDNRARIIAHAEANYRWQYQIKPLVSELKNILAR
jgi:glycosyltransferase involved in cell wall biosynthesis